MYVQTWIKIFWKDLEKYKCIHKNVYYRGFPFLSDIDVYRYWCKYELVYTCDSCLLWVSNMLSEHTEFPAKLLDYFLRSTKSNINQSEDVQLGYPILIPLAFITGNSSLAPLLEGLLAQIHIDMSWEVFGRNRTVDLRITQIC